MPKQFNLLTRFSLKELYLVLKKHGPLADYQLAGFFPTSTQMPQSARRRRRELTGMGWVVKAGTTTSPTGRTVKTWKAL